jgi:hypothetical protein
MAIESGNNIIGQRIGWSNAPIEAAYEYPLPLVSGLWHLQN